MLLSLVALGAEAATFIVTKQTDDDGACTVDDCALREAVQAANTTPGMDTIVLPGGTYQLSLVGPVEENYNMTGDLDIMDDVEVLGDENAPATIVGDGTDRVIQTFDSVVVIDRVTLTGGEGCCGGGFRASGGDVTVIDSVIHNNNVLGDGGAIFIALANVSLIDTTICHNVAGRSGGGITRIGGGLTPSNLNVTNSTISSNSANNGGGIFSESPGETRITNSTIANNTVTAFTSAILSARARGPILSNSIIVGDCGLLNAGNTTSLGGNLQSPDNSCHMLDPTDRLNVPNMFLGPLADNGGPTPTHALLPGSPAVDAALGANCPAQDQRGLPRPLDGDNDGTSACDAGAFELDPLTIPLNVPVLDPRGILALCVLLGMTALLALRMR